MKENQEIKVELETYTVESSTVMNEMEASLIGSVVIVITGP